MSIVRQVKDMENKGKKQGIILNMAIKIIPHANHRYRGTVDDYWVDKKGVHQVKISEMSDWRYTAIIIIHALIEYFGCLCDGIKEEDITAFDVLFECERDAGLHKSEDEPGNDPRACYRKWHIFATKIEILLASELKANWKRYSKEVESL
jgi:hypothetical protein